MPLSDDTRKRIEAEAQRRGVDSKAAIAEAERGSGDPAKGGTRPTAERLLIGFLPFIKVRELRSMWLGLPERIPDDELTCGDYALKHGGAAPAEPAE